MHFTAETSRIRTALLTLGSLVFVAIGIWMVVQPGDAPGFVRVAGVLVPLAWFGWAAILFFGLTTVLWARRFVETGTEIRVGPEGLFYRRWSDVTIPWNAFERAALTEIRRQRFVSLWLRDPAAWPGRGLTARLQKANRAMGFGDLSLGVQGTDGDFDALVEAMASNAPALFGR